jgi:hypothetical protein
MRQIRYSAFSIGSITGDMNVRRPSKTSAMYDPSGLTQSHTKAKINAACSQPTMVMRESVSESFGAEHRVRQVRERGERQNEADAQVSGHIAPQPRT